MFYLSVMNSWDPPEVTFDKSISRDVHYQQKTIFYFDRINLQVVTLNV